MDDADCIERTTQGACEDLSPWHVREALRRLHARVEALEAEKRLRLLNPEIPPCST
jgi:hypothetical protein